MDGGLRHHAPDHLQAQRLLLLRLPALLLPGRQLPGRAEGPRPAALAPRGRGRPAPRRGQPHTARALARLLRARPAVRHGRRRARAAGAAARADGHRRAVLQVPRAAPHVRRRPGRAGAASGHAHHAGPHLHHHLHLRESLQPRQPSATALPARGGAHELQRREAPGDAGAAGDVSAPRGARGHARDDPPRWQGCYGSRGRRRGADGGGVRAGYGGCGQRGGR
mmetsp:Transcript_26426/g.67928  ORF Transcript_26426/g.67928 Transcript_26426/m.67928 type:complete len:223 (-) Transcript_26426:613-1281(-)